MKVKLLKKIRKQFTIVNENPTEKNDPEYDNFVVRYKYKWIGWHRDYDYALIHIWERVCGKYLLWFMITNPARWKRPAIKKRKLRRKIESQKIWYKNESKATKVG